MHVSKHALLLYESKFFGVTSDVSEGCREGFLILIKKQITEPIRKLRDESNNTN